MFVYWQKKPTPALRPFIKHYWHFKRTFTPTTQHEIYPDSYHELIWVKSGTLYIDGKAAPGLFFSGYNEKKIILTGKGSVELFGVRFFAWGLVPFIDMKKIQGRKLTPADSVLNGSEVALLTPRLIEENESFYSRMNDFFASKIIKTSPPSRIDTLSAIYHGSKGALKVQEIARHYSLSNRQLERVIRRATGSTPHDLSMRIRFENVRKALLNDEHTTLSELATEFGYADQSHLNKEFRKFTNLTPFQYKQEFNRLNAHLKSAEGWKWEE